jgi:hypothetical protein
VLRGRDRDSVLSRPEDHYQYEDGNGVATDALMKAFSDIWQRIAVVVLSVSGFAITQVLAIVATHSEHSYFVPLFPCSL